MCPKRDQGCKNGQGSAALGGSQSREETDGQTCLEDMNTALTRPLLLLQEVLLLWPCLLLHVHYAVSDGKYSASDSDGV